MEWVVVAVLSSGVITTDLTFDSAEDCMSELAKSLPPLIKLRHGSRGLIWFCRNMRACFWTIRIIAAFCPLPRYDPAS